MIGRVRWSPDGLQSNASTGTTDMQLRYDKDTTMVLLIAFIAGCLLAGAILAASLERMLGIT
jgi:hypothetical protein